MRDTERQLTTMPLLPMSAHRGFERFHETPAGNDRQSGARAELGTCGGPPNEAPTPG